VADTFDAMTTDRCYQPAMPTIEAVAKIKELSGIRYDPMVVDALERTVDSGEINAATDPALRPDDEF
jgi:HD-GYP domain-containing protein (c-di-GMP phosphodiesterase class II)